MTQAAHESTRAKISSSGRDAEPAQPVSEPPAVPLEPSVEIDIVGGGGIQFEWLDGTRGAITKGVVMSEIQDLFNRYAILMDTIESIKAEIPQLAEAEKQAEAIKKQIQEYAKEHGEANGSGYEVKLSIRGSWDGKLLDGYSKAHPEILEMKSETQVATVKKQK